MPEIQQPSMPETQKYSGRPLPMEGFEVTYLSEKLNCIFDGASWGFEQVE